jgi:hypothetical protein
MKAEINLHSLARKFPTEKHALEHLILNCNNQNLIGDALAALKRSICNLSALSCNAHDSWD